TVSSPGTITAVVANGGKITFSGPIAATNINMVSLTSISNTGSPVLLQSPNNMVFNALGGNVGSLSSPIFVQSLGQVFAGADGGVESLADFNGTSSDNTIHAIPSNPPCIIIFNGVEIAHCSVPSPVPSPSSGTSTQFPFAVPGFDSSYFNLASDYFFLFYFFDKTYVHRDIAIYWHTPAKPHWFQFF
ncbi:MAG: hypothetical protein ACRDFB_02595, partial [Rhabdochlamydiaceae bacterium]